MQLSELETILEGTSPDDWEVISGPPTFLHGYMVSPGPGKVPSGQDPEPQQVTTVEEHFSIAVLRADIDVRIAWGYQPYFDEKEDAYYFEKHPFPDPLVIAVLADVFYRGALVQRHWLVSVDGAHALLPMPTPRVRDAAEITPSDPEGYEWFVTERKVNFARLIHELDKFDKFEPYMRRSGFIVVPVIKP
jgi:hypothetical protein